MIRLFTCISAIVLLSQIQAVHAAPSCTFEKPIEEAFMDAQYRDFENPDQGRGRETQRRILAVSVLMWAEKGVKHPNNPDGLTPEFSGPLEKAVACYTWEGYCGQAANSRIVGQFRTFNKTRDWKKSGLPEYPPAPLLTWAEELLNCANLNAPISFEKGRVTDFTNEAKFSEQLAQCEAGDFIACQSAADITMSGAGPDQLKAATAGCELGDRNLCLSAGQMLRLGGDIAVDPPRAFELLNIGCDKSLPEACFQAGNLVSEGELAGKSQRAAFNLYAKACDLVHQKACSARDRTLADMGGVTAIASGQAFTVNADIETQFDQATLEEIRWGRYDNAGYVARTNCYNERIDVVRSCFAAGWIYEHGLGTVQNGASARGYYAEACKSGSDTACYRYQGLLYEGRGGDQDLYGASDLLAKNCREGDASACDHYHFGVLTTTAFIPAERLAAAFDYYTWHCGAPRNDQAACFNLAILYDNPGFGRHDETIAKHLADQACSSGGVPGACQMMENLAFRQQQRDLAYSYSQSRGGLGGFLSDLGKGISRSSEIAAGKAATQPTRGPVVRPQTASTTLQAQDWREFNNAIQAIENTGTAYNSSCPATNPYC